MTTIITGRENIEMARILAVRSMLGLEVRTTMVRSNRGPSTLSLAKDILRRIPGLGHEGTKRGAYVQLCAVLAQHDQEAHARTDEHLAALNPAVKPAEVTKYNKALKAARKAAAEAAAE